MSDEPRTEALANTYKLNEHPLLDFARQLERELRAVTVERGELALKLAGAECYIEEQKKKTAITADELIERCAQAGQVKGDWRGRECAGAIRDLKGRFVLSATPSSIQATEEPFGYWDESNEVLYGTKTMADLAVTNGEIIPLYRKPHSAKASSSIPTNSAACSHPWDEKHGPMPASWMCGCGTKVYRSYEDYVDD